MYEDDMVHSFELLEYPSHGGGLCGFIDLIGKRFVASSECSAQAALREGVNEKRKNHNHEQCIDSAWTF